MHPCCVHHCSTSIGCYPVGGSHGFVHFRVNVAKQLRELRVSNNLVASLAGLDRLAALQLLVLSSNRITSLQVGTSASTAAVIAQQIQPQLHMPSQHCTEQASSLTILSPSCTPTCSSHAPCLIAHPPTVR